MEGEREREREKGRERERERETERWRYPMLAVFEVHNKESFFLYWEGWGGNLKSVAIRRADN